MCKRNRKLSELAPWLSLVISRLDYGNSLLCGITAKELRNLQAVQNRAARLITLTRSTSHITPTLQALHWLPVSARIDFKVLVLIYKALSDSAPSYIRDLLTVHQPTRHLRSSSQSMLHVPMGKMSTVGDRAFSIYGPTAWNKLPLSIKELSSVHSFKSHLKTHLFNMYFAN